MKVVLRCNNISKNYGKNEVIKNFNYSFGENGLYVLYGSSGSGKTTLLNIFTGMTDFVGTVNIYEKKYSNLVKYSESKNYISYISQNNYFIDYLTVYDNLVLSLNNKKYKKNIETLLKKFELYDKINNYPTQLSGGEQQRLSIISALLQEKKIIILDEPTSSLDFDNRNLLFKILKNLKENYLIICATHDQALIDIADFKIDCNKFDSVKNNYPMKVDASTYKKDINIFPYMLKRISFKNINKKTNIFLIIIFFIVICIINMCYNHELKLEQSLLNTYNINYVNYECNIDNRNEDLCDSLIKRYNGFNNLFSYSGNIIAGKIVDGLYEAYDYDTMLRTLPFDSNIFANSNNYLELGTYFKTEKDIILGIKKAQSINIDMEKLIGKEYKIKLPNKTETFRIVGIFKDISEDVYLGSLVTFDDINNQIFISDKYVNNYRDSKDFRLNDKYVRMTAFFNNSKDLLKFYNDYKSINKENDARVINFDNNFIDFRWQIQALQYYLYPTVIVASIICLMFYFQSEYINNKYKKHILSIYNYYGYNWSKIIASDILVSVLSVVLKFIIAFILAVIFGTWLNNYLLDNGIIKFILFLTDYSLCLKLFIGLTLISTILATINSLCLKKKGWINSLKEERDLL